MTKVERTQKIEAYGRAYDQLKAALEELPKEMWHFKATPESWSVHETAVHITDSEANSFIRCRRFIAEPGTTVMAYDEEAWANALRYRERSVEDALELFRCLRQATYKLIQKLPESVWSNTVFHPENGVMTLDDWLDVYANHIPEHVSQMKQNYDQWQKQVSGDE